MATALPTEDKGQPLQVVRMKEERDKDGNMLTLDTCELMKLLGRDDVKQCPVVVFAIAGAYRTGKSFLLNFLMRYLRALEKGNIKNWIGEANEHLTGFDWQQGSDATTSGILMWSEPFHVTTSEGKKVAVLLMDTQGLFENKLRPQDAATIFALSTMISSVQVYNVVGKVEEPQLKHLELFVETTQMVMSLADLEDEEKPFQRLVYLVRDWIDPSKYRYGEKGGEDYLNATLKVRPEQPEDLKKVREHIHACFDKLECFLLPFPGKAAAIKEADESSDSEDDEDKKEMTFEFKGQPELLDSKFKKHLKKLGPFLLDQDHIEVKKRGDVIMTGEELANSFLIFMAIFQSGKLPQAATTREAIIEEYNNLIMHEELGDHCIFFEKMNQALSESNPQFDTDELEKLIRDSKQDTIQRFRSKARGEEEERQAFLKKIEDWLDSWGTEIILERKRRHLNKREVKDRHCKEALELVKQTYKQQMEDQIVDDTIMEEGLLEELHETAKTNTIASFQQLTEEVDTWFTFMQELEDFISQHFAVYLHRNKMRMLEMKQHRLYGTVAANEAKTEYKRDLDTRMRAGGICDVTEELRTCAKKAEDKFVEMTSSLPEQIQEEVRNGLRQELKGLEETYAILIAEQASKAEKECEEALMKAKQKYREKMKSASTSKIMFGQKIEDAHMESQDYARSVFQTHATNNPNEAKRFLEKLEEFFDKELPRAQEHSNEAQRIEEKNKEVFSKAVAMYTAQMEQACKVKDITEKDMDEHHDKYIHKALGMFDKTIETTGTTDELREKLLHEISGVFDKIKVEQLRKAGNKVVDALLAAKKNYQDNMTLRSGNKALSAADLEELHHQSKQQAEEALGRACRNPQTKDKYLQQLHKFCRQEYQNIQIENKKRLLAEEQRIWTQANIDSRRLYREEMDKRVKPGAALEAPALDRHHQAAVTAAMKLYKTKTEHCVTDSEAKEQELKRELNEMKAGYVKGNTKRREEEMDQVLEKVIEEAKKVYLNQMRISGQGRELSAVDIEKLHKGAKDAATWNLQTSLAGKEAQLAELTKRLHDFCDGELTQNKILQTKEEQIKAAYDEAFRKAEDKFKELMNQIYGRNQPVRTEQEMDQDIASCLDTALGDLTAEAKEWTTQDALPDLQRQLRQSCQAQKQVYAKKNKDNDKAKEVEAEVICQGAVKDAMKEYEKIMDEACQLGRKYKAGSSFDECHNDAKKKAKTVWEAEKSDNLFLKERYKNQLEKELENAYQRYKNKNELNNPNILPEPRKVIEIIGDSTQRARRDGIVYRSVKWVASLFSGGSK